MSDKMMLSLDDLMGLSALAEATLTPDYSNFAEVLKPPFEHLRGCPAHTTGRDSECTCGLSWRIELSTTMTLLTAWQKRAGEAEAENAALKADAEKGRKIVAALEAETTAELFEDGVSGDLYSAGIHTTSAAYMAGRQDVLNDLHDAIDAAKDRT